MDFLLTADFLPFGLIKLIKFEAVISAILLQVLGALLQTPTESLPLDQQTSWFPSYDNRSPSYFFVKVQHCVLV